MTRTHLAHGQGSRCGRGTLADVVATSTPERFVTCGTCLRLASTEQREAAALAMVDAAAIAERLAAPPPFVPSGPYTPAVGASELAAPDRRIIARSIAGDEPDERGRWSSVREALGAVATARDEGVPLASTSSPSRFGKGKVSGGSTVRVHSVATQLRCIEAEKALEIACSQSVRVNRLLRVEPVHVSIIADLGLLGRRTRTRIAGRKSYRHDREPVLVEDIIAAVKAAGGPRLLTAQVHRVRAKVEGRIAEILYRKELVTRAAMTRGVVSSEKGREQMAAPAGFDVDGWKEIGALIGRGEDTAQRLARRKEDPLPVRWYLGRAIARRADLHAWIARQVEAA